MKTTELRIGNCLYTTKTLLDNNSFSNSENDYRPVFVNAIDNDNIRDSDGYWYNIGYFKPIALTEEWLLKFGFNKEGNSYKLKNFGRFMFYEFSEYPSFYPAGYTKTLLRQNDLLHHVHQLQNLYFALCGEELTIKE